MRTTSLFIFIIFIITNTISVANAQENRISELKTQTKSLGKTPSFSNDSLRIELLNKISVLYSKQSKDSALFYVNEAINDAKKMKNENLIAVSYYNKGKIYEYWKDFENAEENYIYWYEIRKKQGGIKLRWALSGMRVFYTNTKQIEKLKEIDKEWVLVLDKQYDESIISNWNSSKTLVEEYRLSLYPVLENLMGLEEYFFAEELLIHMFEKDEKLTTIYWGSGDFPYLKATYYMERKQDTLNLNIWYKHWLQSIEKYYPYDYFENILWTMDSNYPKEYFTPEMDKEYDRLLLECSLKTGGYETYNIILYNMLYNYKPMTITKMRMIVTGLQVSIKLGDKRATNDYLKKLYEFSDKFLISEANIEHKIDKMLSESPEILSEKCKTKWKNTIMESIDCK